MKLGRDARDHFEKLAELPLEPRKFPRRTPQEMRAIVDALDAAPLGSPSHDELAQQWMDYQIEGLRAYYAMLNDRDMLYVNRLMLLWRDAIPPDWTPPAGAKSRRVAGMLPVDFGDPTLTNSYSENSAVVFDYGAVLGNNQVKTNEAMRLPVQLKMKDPERTPYAVEKFEWNREKRRFEVAWVRPDVSSPNSTPVVSTRDRQLHVVGIDGGEWVMQTLDWDTGETRAVYRMGASERFDPIMLALELLPSGDPVYPSFGGIVHLNIGPSRAAGADSGAP